MTSKENRSKIYEYIKANIGEIKPEFQRGLSEMIKNYGKSYSEVLLTQYNELLKSHNKVKEIKPIIKPVDKKPKYNPNYFNSDFLNKG